MLWMWEKPLNNPFLRFAPPLLTFQQICFILLCHSEQEIGKNVGSFNSFSNSGAFHGHIILSSVQTRRYGSGTFQLFLSFCLIKTIFQIKQYVPLQNTSIQGESHENRHVWVIFSQKKKKKGCFFFFALWHYFHDSPPKMIKMENKYFTGFSLC